MNRRADQFLVEHGWFESRARAQAAIAAGLVRADGETVRKASQMLSEQARIQAEEAHPWVSRGGVKLAAALDAFLLDPAGLDCLDIGASTGGFTEVLLRRGARSVLAVDVGHGQFAARLVTNRCVKLLERKDARSLIAADLVAPPQAIVCDVSFISLRLALPPALGLAADHAWLISLIKPQFEVGPNRLSKGRVKCNAAMADACDNVRMTVESLGWESIGIMPSPIMGGDGAREFLYAARG